MYQNSNGAQGATRQTPANKLEFTGVIKTRGNYPEIKMIQSSNGGASIKFSLECREYMNRSDENGNPKYRVTYVPVSVWTNRNITTAMLGSIVPGMKVHVVGRWSNYKTKDANGNDCTRSECEAYILEVLEQPQFAPMPQPQYGQQQYAPQGGFQPQYPAQGTPAPQYQQPQYQGQQYQQPPRPAVASPTPGAPAPQTAHNPYQPQGPTQAPGYVNQEQQAPAGAPATPPYYRPPQQSSPAQQGPQGTTVNIDDMPPA